MNDRLREILADLRRALEDIYGDRLVKLVLFGSRARGDEESESDIDVAVVLRGPVDAAAEIRRTAGMVADLCLSHERLVSCVFFDEDYFERRNGPLLRNIRREGIAV